MLHKIFTEITELPAEAVRTDALEFLPIGNA